MRAEDFMTVKMKKANCSSWVVEMEKMLGVTDPLVEMERWSRPSVYQVPQWLKNMTNSTAYRPQLVSLGPFHHGEPDLLPMEKHKRRAVLHLVKRSGKPLGEFVAAIEEVAHELQDAYENLDEKWRGASRVSFVKMMVTDGCFLLEMIRMLKLLWEGAVLKDYAPNDPVFSVHGFFSLYFGLRSDMIVMENQLPLLVLQRLVTVLRGTSPCAREINDQVLLLLGCARQDGINDLGLHPLDILHKSFRGPRPDPDEMHQGDEFMPSAVELNDAGIHFKLSNTRSIHDVDFKNGVLSMPLAVVDDQTKHDFLNLMAFERLHGDSGNDLTSYLCFMNYMINTERDVALLRSKGLIENFLSTDKEVAQLFNNMGKGAVMVPFSKLTNVQGKVNAYCTKRRNKWRASFVHTYLSNPWVFISLVAAVILLLATLLQTVYTVLSFYT